MSDHNFIVQYGLAIGNMVADATSNSLTTSGNVTAGNLVAATLVSTVNLSVTGTTVLGNVSNITITGGTAGQYLQTDGSGNLHWVSNGFGRLSLCKDCFKRSIGVTPV